MVLRFEKSIGAHTPCCGGICLVPALFGLDNVLPLSLAFLIFTTVMWAFVAGEYLFIVSPAIIVVAGVLFCTAVAMLFLTWCTEPGILPAMAVREPEKVAPPPVDDTKKLQEQPDSTPTANRKDVEMSEMEKKDDLDIEIGSGKKSSSEDANDNSAKAKVMESSKSKNLDRNLRTYKVYVDGRQYLLPELRAKYCRQTRNIVENFDHYCPWVGNAVGIRNYKYFFFFLVTLVLYCIMIAVTGILTLVTSAEAMGLRVLSAIVSVIACMSLVALVNLLVYNIGLISKNLTTNEDLKRVFHRKTNPHDKGCWQNWYMFCCRKQRESYFAV